MAWQELTSAEAVLGALAEFDALGREAFLKKYGFGRARSFFVVHDGKRYDSKAIVGVAFGRQFPERGPLSSDDFSGGEATVRTKLEELGFTVQDDNAPGEPHPSVPDLVPGGDYSWGKLGEVFGFKPFYLLFGGGVVSCSSALLFIIHRRRDKDYWDGEDLIGTGETYGVQTLHSANLAVVKNEKPIFVFRWAGSQILQFLGTARCQEYWWEDVAAANERSRQILRFRLRMKGTVPQHQPQAEADVVQASPAIKEATAEPQASRPSRRPTHRAPRPFDESRPPAAFISSGERVSPEETLALIEKAVQDHHTLLVALKRQLLATGWSDIEEIPSAVDLWARAPLTGLRVIFEAKTIDTSNEVHQTRAALSQLLEYRHFCGAETDELCLVANAPISEERERFLAAMNIVCLTYDGERFRASGALDCPWLAEFVTSH